MLWMVRKSNKIIYKVVYIHALNVCCLASFEIIVGFGAKFLEITVSTPKPVTPIKDKRDTQAILRRTQDIKKERWLNNDTMGAVNDLGELGDISTLAEPEVVQQIIEKRNQSS